MSFLLVFWQLLSLQQLWREVRLLCFILLCRGSSSTGTCKSNHYSESRNPIFRWPWEPQLFSPAHSCLCKCIKSADAHAQLWACENCVIPPPADAVSPLMLTLLKDSWTRCYCPVYTIGLNLVSISKDAQQILAWYENQSGSRLSKNMHALFYQQLSLLTGNLTEQS